MNKEDIKKLPNYVKMDKYTDIKIELTDSQKNLLLELIKEIGSLEKELELITISSNVLLMPLIYKEGESSDLIENTQTQFEDIAYDVEGITNVYQWQTRTLLNIYVKWLKKIDSGLLYLSTATARDLHIELYDDLSKSNKFSMNNFDPKPTIEKIKPGYIMNDDNDINWIGGKSMGTLEEKLRSASVIPIMPSDKLSFMNDMFDNIEKKIKNKEYTIEDFIKFHPVFEGIHPFKDGNGRIGRALMTIIFHYWGLTTRTIALFSYALKNKKDQYFIYLKEFQLEKKYNNWAGFFIDIFIDTKRKLSMDISGISKLWKKYYNKQIEKNTVRKDILLMFFEHYKLNKTHTIKLLINSGVPSNTAYRQFDYVVEHIKAKHDNGYFSFVELKEVIEK